MRATLAARPIGVFDSGVGGLSILKALRAELPGENFIYLADSAFAPYGERDEGYVIERARANARQFVVGHRIKALVVACNTATAAAIHLLSAENPQLPIVGVEPALSPAAAASRTGQIGVLATRGTLASAKFGALQASLQSRARFVLMACDGLAEAIENDDTGKTEALCEQFVRALGPMGSQEGQIDTLVLGCTHYPFASRHIEAAAGSTVTLLETGEPVSRQTRRLLDASDRLNAQTQGKVQLLATGSDAGLLAAARRWL